MAKCITCRQKSIQKVEVNGVTRQTQKTVFLKGQFTLKSNSSQQGLLISLNNGVMISGKRHN